ncbi:hypothetical protein LVD17_17860 [Fulvivirga ulvae]|uniref:hypothetical protein n=1 Tax=Fulvivirga ulvae TaxID=2904245 RepID=UPI001F2F7999|nr:hypothetical protein [Fulvivirga ulvae]UII30163.1 hypothetical protein LVD17_17860 [Fulvivirga ulvae]
MPAIKKAVTLTNAYGIQRNTPEDSFFEGKPQGWKLILGGESLRFEGWKDGRVAELRTLSRSGTR